MLKTYQLRQGKLKTGLLVIDYKTIAQVLP